MHLGIVISYITVADDNSLHIVYSYDQLRGRAYPADRPALPVTHILEDPARGTLTVFAYSEVFECNRTFQDWRKIATLDLDDEPGHSDAVRTIHRIGDAFVIATSLNGYQSLHGAKQVSHSFDNVPTGLSAEPHEPPAP